MNLSTSTSTFYYVGKIHMDITPKLYQFFFCKHNTTLQYKHNTTLQCNNYNTYTTNETLPTLMTIQYLDNLQYYILLTVWYSNHSKIM